MQEEMIKVDVQAIMAEIRENIKKRGYEKNDLDFNDLDDLKEILAEMNENSDVQCWRTLNGNKITVFIKKAIRKCIKFYVEPIVEEQNHYNRNTIEAISQIYSKLADEQEQRIKELEERMDSLNKKCIQLEAQIKEK